MPTMLLACTLVLGMSAMPAAADEVIFTNLGPNSSYNTVNATFFGFDTGEEGDPDTNFSRAMAFVAGATGALTTIEMPLQFPWSFSGGTLQVNLFESDEGLPGRVLESFTSSGELPEGTLSLFTSTLNPLLFSGRTYFLEARTLGQADGLWYQALMSGQQTFRDVYRVNNGPWQVGSRNFEAAFRVSGDVNAAPVPEPATLVLLGTGLAMAGIRRRRAKEN